MEYRDPNTRRSKYLLKISLLLFPALMIPEYTKALSEGEKVPPFTVYAGKQEKLHLSDLSGRIIVLTYESKDRVNDNAHFKDRVLKEFPDHSTVKSPVTVLAVISCFEFFWPLDRYCISEVQKNAEILGMALYDDRTGKMQQNLGLKKNESNVLIIDRQGIARYIGFGKLSEEEAEKVVRHIKTLCR